MPIIDTTYSPRGPGFGGLPAWQVLYIATWDPATIAVIEANMVPKDRLKMTVLPNRREIVAMRTDGQVLTPVFFTPTPYQFNIAEAIQIGPGEIDMISGVQTEGTYVGYAICSARYILQQTKPNDY